MTRLALIRVIPAVERYALNEQRASVVRVILEFGADASRVETYETAWSLNEDRASEFLCDWWDARDSPNGIGGEGVKWKAALEAALKALVGPGLPHNLVQSLTSRAILSKHRYGIPCLLSRLLRPQHVSCRRCSMYWTHQLRAKR
jgi:hypothetical protein